MEWRERGGVSWLEARMDGAVAAFPTRSAGSLKESHALLAEALGIPASRIVASHQVHGAELAFHGEGNETPAEADGQVLARSGLAGLVYTADCLPVALAGPRGAAILHCGWRGLAAGIVARGVEATGAGEAAIGPGIGPCCYEVGGDVLGAFSALGEGVASGRMLDLAEVVRRLLRERGVDRVQSADICTRCHADLFFSHRRDGAPGRQGGLVWVEKAGG